MENLLCDSINLYLKSISTEDREVASPDQWSKSHSERTLLWSVTLTTSVVHFTLTVSYSFIHHLSDSF